MICSTEKTREALNLLYDEFGDAFFSLTSENELRQIFSKMSSKNDEEKSSSKRKRKLDEFIPLSQSTIDIEKFANPLDDKEKLRNFISEFENNYFPDESSEFGLFRLFYIYFDQYEVLGDETTFFLPAELKLVVLESQLHGARIAHSLTADVTHVVSLKPDANDEIQLERIKQLKKINRERATKFHLVSFDWIKASIEHQRLLKELPFVI